MKSNDAMKLILIVPMGVELKIFPWSVHALSDYLKPCGLPLDVTIWDLRHDEQLSEIRQAFGPVQDEVFGVLTKKYRDVFDVNRTSLPFGVLASMGSSFLDAAAKHEQGRSRSALALAKRRYGARLDQLKQDVEARILRGIAQHTEGWRSGAGVG